MEVKVHTTSPGVDPVEIVPAERVERLAPRELSDALERGRIVYFPTSPVLLPSEEEQRFLREQLPSLLKRKNVSLYPGAGRLVGVDGDEAARRTREILSAHAARVRSTLARLMPAYMQGPLDPGISSFRPLQERGRDLSVHASNELLHVDAGAYGATHGGRILRFFINLNPKEERVWLTKGAFNELFTKYAEQAGLGGTSGVSVREGLLDRAFSGFIQGAMAAGISMARVIDSSPYDRAMRRFHNFLKENAAFQEAPDGRVEISFPPLSAWMVFTDGVSHACLSGQYALVDTLVIPLDRVGIPELSPFHVLAGRSRASAG